MAAPWLGSTQRVVGDFIAGIMWFKLIDKISYEFKRQQAKTLNSECYAATNINININI